MSRNYHWHHSRSKANTIFRLVPHTSQLVYLEIVVAQGSISAGIWRCTRFSRVYLPFDRCQEHTEGSVVFATVQRNCAAGNSRLSGLEAGAENRRHYSHGSTYSKSPLKSSSWSWRFTHRPRRLRTEYTKFQAGEGSFRAQVITGACTLQNGKPRIFYIAIVTVISHPPKLEGHDIESR